jgi:hypothetical protein
LCTIVLAKLRIFRLGLQRFRKKSAILQNGSDNGIEIAIRLRRALQLGTFFELDSFPSAKALKPSRHDRAGAALGARLDDIRGCNSGQVQRRAPSI